MLEISKYLLLVCLIFSSDIYAGGDETIPVDFDYDLYDLSSLEVPKKHYQLIKAAVVKIESLLKEEGFLNQIKSKNDWTYPPDGNSITGAEVVKSIIERKNILTGKITKPTMSLYYSPTFGIDVCGGKSFFFIKTKVTGCALQNSDSSTTVHKNLNKIGKTSESFSGFYIHEWLHAAGYSHAGNTKQCTKKKRNSVPIYIACIAEKNLLGESTIGCEKACNQN